MQKISPCLWFDMNCEEAINFYVSTFKNSRITSIQRYPTDMQVGPVPNMGGKIIAAMFELDGYAFIALDGGPMFKLNPSVSMMLNFDPSLDPNASANLDAMWAKLSEGGKVLMEVGEYPFSKRYGWVQDRFGMSWQLILTKPEGEPRPSIIPSMVFIGENAGKAEEALKRYVSIFKDSKMGNVARRPTDQGPDKEGTALFAEAMLAGQWFAAMDSAYKHEFAFNEAVSFTVDCADQAEVDYFWDKLTADGGEESQCGWLKDKYGMSWQIVPKRLGELLTDPDKGRAERAMKAMLGMKKIIVADLEKAAQG